MRISTVPGDPGFREDARTFVVLLNGEPVAQGPNGRLLITADEELRVVRYLLCDENGEILMVAGVDVMPPVEERGKVEILRMGRLNLH